MRLIYLGEYATNKAVAIVLSGADKAGVSTTDARDWLPPIAGSYVGWSTNLGKVATPLRIARVNYKVFKTCMRFSNNSLTTSWTATAVVCLATLALGRPNHI